MSQEICSGKGLINLLRTQKTRKDKIDLLDEALETCCSLAIEKTKPKATRRKKPKKKRQMSGYNCFLKVCAKTPDKSFQECLKAKGWKKLDEAQNNEYREMARQGCTLLPSD